MPVNMGIVFLIGAVLGWVSVKVFRPEEHLQGLVIACCSSGKMYSKDVQFYWLLLSSDKICVLIS
jgi:hypothetical protein